MTDQTDIPGDPMEAAEYALGLLSPEEAAAFEGQLSRSPELQEEVANWRESLAKIAEAVPEIDPPPAIYAAITDRLFAERGRRRVALPRLFEIAIGAVAAAFFAFGVIFFTQANISKPNSVIATEIAAEDRSLVVRAVFVEETGELRLVREIGAAETGRALELWLIYDGGSPVSLGLLTKEPDATIVVPPNLRWRVQGATLAVSDEPAGGSPTDAPTGAVLATGVVTGV